MSRLSGQTIALGSAVVLVLVMVVVIASGSGAHDGRRPLVLIQKADCSPSMRGAQPGMPSAAERITVDGARASSVLIAGSFVGDPGRSPTPWPVVHQYPSVGGDAPGAGGNANIQKERILLEGRRQAAAVAGLVRCQTADHGRGSPLLSVLAQCADELARAVAPENAERRVVIYTDGAIIGDGLDARDGITDDQMQAAVAKFGPLLHGLRGAKVWFVGVGSGTTITPETLRVIKTMMAMVISRGGGELLGFESTSASYPFAT